jgi:transmembrane sensor
MTLSKDERAHKIPVTRLSKYIVSERDLKLEAANWFAALCDDSFGKAEARLLESWLAESESHRRTFAALTGNSAKLAVIADVPELKSRRAGALDRLHSRRRPPRRGLAVGAALLALGAAGIFWELNAQFARIETAPGQRTAVTLTDGSTIEANTATRIEVRFNLLQRRVQLLGGEANFAVRPRWWQPFIVETGDLSVRAVGTVFDVVESPKEVRVVVSEGRVRVDTPVRRVGSVGIRQKLVYDRRSGTTLLVPARLDQDLAWREGRLRFEGRPLGEVIEEFARYSTTRVVLADPQLGKLSISGDFDPREPLFFARAVAKLHSLSTSEPAPNQILLSPQKK